MCSRWLPFAVELSKVKQALRIFRGSYLCRFRKRPAYRDSEIPPTLRFQLPPVLLLNHHTQQRCEGPLDHFCVEVHFHSHLRWKPTEYQSTNALSSLSSRWTRHL